MTVSPSVKTFVITQYAIITTIITPLGLANWNVVCSSKRRLFKLHWIQLSTFLSKSKGNQLSLCSLFRVFTPCMISIEAETVVQLAFKIFLPTWRETCTIFTLCETRNFFSDVNLVIALREVKLVISLRDVNLIILLCDVKLLISLCDVNFVISLRDVNSWLTTYIC